jgi:16S rRNA (guanine1516-N2)-methyltransferase
MISDLQPGCVTVSRRVRPRDVERAQALARRVGLPFITSPDAPQPRLVVERVAIHLETALGTIRSHPGMGLVRTRRMLRGEEFDPLVSLSGAQPGDRVLDGTFGFGQDALVLAWAVGEGGRVVGVEKSPVLAGLAIEGMRHWPEPAATLMRRVSVEVASLQAYLAQQEDRSFDVVYLDPMFRRPRSAAPDFLVLRTLAEMSALDDATFAEARRVARRCVVMKDAWPGREIVRLGGEPLDVDRRKDVVYGVWRLP